MPTPKFSNLVAELEAHPNLRGKRVADVPELAGVRRYYRRGFYRWANWHFGLAIFNIICATSPLVWLWPFNAFAAALSVTMFIWCERKARALTRQLHRPAAVQMARDLLEIKD